MIQEKHFSAKYDFHTGLLSKSCFFLGFALFLIALVEFIFGFNILLEPGSYFALGILFVGLVGISWFFHFQFAKLSEVATEIENEQHKE